MSYLDAPDTLFQIFLRWLFHFALGALAGALPAVMAFAIMTETPSINLWKAAGLAFLFFCVPCGLIAWLIGLVNRGEWLYGCLRFLGIKFYFYR